MRLVKLVNKNSSLLRCEIRKCSDKNIYIISVIYFILLLLYTHINNLLGSILSKIKGDMQIASENTIEESIYYAIFSRGVIIFAILIIVAFGNELSKGTFRKSLVSGYNRFQLFYASLFRINIFILLFIVLSSIVVLAFYLPIFDVSHDNNFIFRILSIYISFFYVGLISLSVILLTERIYLSIIIVTILILSSYALFMLNQITLDSPFVVFFPFIILEYLENPALIQNDNNFYISYFGYLVLFSWVSFRVFDTKRFI